MLTKIAIKYFLYIKYKQRLFSVHIVSNLIYTLCSKLEFSQVEGLFIDFSIT